MRSDDGCQECARLRLELAELHDARNWEVKAKEVKPSEQHQDSWCAYT